MSQIEDCWYMVWDALKEHNPSFLGKRSRGIDCVLDEIKRLQQSDRILHVQNTAHSAHTIKE